MKRLKYFVTGVCLVSLLGASLCGCGKTEEKKSRSDKKHKESSSEQVDTDDNDVSPADIDIGDLGTSDKDESEKASIDIDSVNWEDMYEWTDNEITSLKDVPDAIKDNGVLVIPAKCETIAESAMAERNWIKEVRFEDSSKITMIGNNAFQGCSQLHSFVFPENSNLFQADNYMQMGTIPFGNNRVFSKETKIHNVVLPNGTVTYYFVLQLSDYFVGIPVNNQVYMESLYCPEDFEIKYDDYGDDSIPVNKKFAKYTQKYYEENYSDYGDIQSTAKFTDIDCTIYVVEGSWADLNFDEWTAGDLVKKEYWDGKSYALAENEPVWDIEDIVIWYGDCHTRFDGLEDEYEVKTVEGDEHLYDGYLTGSQFKALTDEIYSMVEAGTLSENRAACRIYIDGTCDATEKYFYTDDESVITALIDKYTK